jgi:hypothetical protein
VGATAFGGRNLTGGFSRKARLPQLVYQGLPGQVSRLPGVLFLPGNRFHAA